MTKQSNFDGHTVVSAKKSGVRVIRLTLSSDAKLGLAAKSSGIPSRSQSEPEKPKPVKGNTAEYAVSCDG